MTKSLRFIPERCTGCLRCELACSQTHVGSYQPAKSVIKITPLEGHTSYAPYTCVQCAEGWCMAACPVDAIGINGTGAKVVNAQQCVGCQLCTIACPFGTMFMDMDTKKAIKCDLCDGNPACVTACPVSAIEWVEGESEDWLGGFTAGRTGYDLRGLAES